MRERVARWGRLLFEFAVNQGLAQAAGMLSGLIYVRFMPINQYALYALSLGSLAFVSVGSDLGLTGSLAYFWRQSKQNGGPIEPKIAIVRRLRSVFLAAAGVVCGALFYKSATSLSASPANAIGCFVLIIITAWSQLHASVELLLMRLQGQQRQSYYCEAAGSVARLAAAGAMIATGVYATAFGLAGGLVGSFSMLAALRLFSGPPTPTDQTIDRSAWREVARYLLPVSAGVVVFMLQEPLILWLAATRGGATPVSEAFAIGRIAAVFALLGNFIIIVVTPRLAGIRDDAHFMRMGAIIVVLLVAFAIVVLTLTYVFPSIPLLLIGPNYAHLDKEVLIGVTTACISTLLTLVILANRIRGWVRLDPVIAVLQLVAILVMAMSWSFRDSASVLSLSMYLSIFSLAGAFAISICGLRWPALVKAGQ